ncbi:MAG: trimethylamine methyltransferase family protein [Planctomycetota bacterium]
MPFLLEMTAADKARMHAAVLRVLAEMGVKVENRTLLDKLRGFGAEVDLETEVARFPSRLIQEFLDRVEPPAAPDSPRPAVYAGTGIYMGKYLNPATGRHEDWTERKLADYVKVARALPGIDGVEMLCCPVAGVPGEIHPLYSKYLNWKLGMSHVNYAVHDTAMIPYIEEFHQIRAEALKLDCAKSLRCGVFMISPLKFGRTEAEQFVYFAERGYKAFIAAMISMGGSGPVTAPGSVAVHLAEQIFTNIMNFIYYGTRSLYFGASISPLDMRNSGFCYGRPEKAVANLMFGQMAEFYRAESYNQTGVADAKVPGSEAAAQKLITALPDLVWFRYCSIGAGLLSVDEVCSPIQLIIDHEMVGALRRLIQPEPINDDTLGFDALVEAGHGGVFTDKMHTALHCREAVWAPELWTADLFAALGGQGSQESRRPGVGEVARDHGRSGS